MADHPSSHDRAQAAMTSIAETFQTRGRHTDHQASSTTSATNPPPIYRRPYTNKEERQYLQQDESERKTVLYLAYGSNLSDETFRGNRGIRPISQINVQVPSLRLTFDLPGIAYAEPCFANSARRDPDNDPPREEFVPYKDDDDEDEDGNAIFKDGNEKLSPLLPTTSSNQSKDSSGSDKYRKNRWHKGMIGVVYEVTPADYAHIIATEGGGSSYADILVACHPFASSDPSSPVPQNPTLEPFRAHTLFAPVTPPGEKPPSDGSGRLQRPDTSYAQPSARYLKLITDGAAERELPYEYQRYLREMRSYRITSFRQRVGQGVFLAFWMPVVLMIFALGRALADERGRLPKWLRDFTGVVFKAAWGSYDRGFKGVFGDGERTVGDDGGDDDDDEDAGQRSRGGRLRGGKGDLTDFSDLEKGESLLN